MNHQFTDQTPQVWPTLPVVVLVDEYTASAAEIIAGALQDNDRAVIVGTATFGKGLVQTLWPFGDGKGLKLTTGRWYTPSGRTIQRTAKSQDEQQRLAIAEASHDDLRWLDSLPSFKTVSGRTVKGGGGIVPDRIVRADTLTAGGAGFRQGDRLERLRFSGTRWWPRRSTSSRSTASAIPTSRSARQCARTCSIA